MGFRIAPLQTLSLAATLAIATSAVSSASNLPKPTQAQRNMALAEFKLGLSAHLPTALKAPFVHRSVDIRSLQRVIASTKKTSTPSSEVFVSDASSNIVLGFATVPPTGTPNLLVAGGLSNPAGLTVDKSGNLYVANTTGQSVTVFAPPYNKIKAVLPDPGEVPGDVAVDPATGVVAVTNLETTTGGPGSVSFYKSLSSTAGPYAVVADNRWYELFYCAFDEFGDLYVDGLGSGGTQVGIVQGESHPLTISTFTDLSGAFVIPGGIQVTKRFANAVGDAIAILDVAPPLPFFGPTIFTFNAPTSLLFDFDAFATTQLTPAPFTFAPSGGAVDFAFNTDQTKVLTAGIFDGTSFPFSFGALEAETYPNGQQLLYKDNYFTLPLGVAYYPPALP